MPTSQSGRKIVWVLGAGASRAAGATAKVRNGKVLIPTQEDFWPTILRFASSEDRKIIESFLFKYFLRYDRRPPNIKTNSTFRKLSIINVEEVFTFLSERIFSPSTDGKLRKEFQEKTWPTLVKVVSKAIQKFQATKLSKQIYKAFFKNQFKSRDSIISFNYDTILESCLKRAEYKYGGIEPGTGIHIFKPHGSVNWGYDANSQNILITPEPAEPVIVAPTHLKFSMNKEIEPMRGFLDKDERFKKIWAEMERELYSAKAICFIGYSFPEADLYFSSILRTALQRSNRDTRLIIVNPDSKRIGESLAKRFGLPRENLSLHFDFKSFSSLKRAELLP